MSTTKVMPGGRPAGAWRRTGGAVSISYEVRGETGSPLVMVHGLGYGRLGWGRFADLLAGRVQLVLIDNRGIGDSDAPPGPYSVSEMADDIEGVLDDLGLVSCDLLGTSLGGMVALELALRAPERFDHLALLAAGAGGDLVPLPASTLSLLRGEIAVSKETPRRLVAGALSPVSVEGRPQLVDEILALRQLQPQSQEAWRAQAAASAGFSLSQDLKLYTNPALVVAGLDDAVIDPASSVALAERLPAGRLELLADLGHLSFMEAPELLAELVLEFLGSPAVGGGSPQETE